MLIKELFGLGAPVLYGSLRDLGPVNPDYVPIDPTAIFGVELEIEDVPNVHGNAPNWAHKGFVMVADGSLRNNGMEFVSKPMSEERLMTALTKFLAQVKGNNHYSDRTSVHVHMNCQDMTADQVSALSLAYNVFENLYFDLAGIDRYNNIFCVPLRETLAVQQIMQTISSVNHTAFCQATRHWPKYTAFNLQPLGAHGEVAKGTVEFRHLPGTNDVWTIMNFVRAMAALRVWVMRNSMEQVKRVIMDLNTSSSYHALVHEVFDGVILRTPADKLPLALEDGVIAAKLALFTPVPAELLVPRREVHDFLGQVQRGERDLVNPFRMPPAAFNRVQGDLL